MDNSWSSHYLLVFVALIGGVMNLYESWALAADDSLVSTLPPRIKQYRGLERVGTTVALILGFLIVPAGVIGILVLLIHKCVTSYRKSRGSPAKEDKPTLHESAKAVPTLFMNINSGDGSDTDVKSTNVLGSEDSPV